MSAPWPQVAFASLMRRAILVAIITVVVVIIAAIIGGFVVLSTLPGLHAQTCSNALPQADTHTRESDCVSVACLCLLRLISALSCAFCSEKRNETMFALIAKHEFERQIQILLCTTVCTCRCVSLPVSLHNTCVSCKKKQTNPRLAPRPECKSRWPDSLPPSFAKNGQNESQQS